MRLSHAFIASLALGLAAAPALAQAEAGGAPPPPGEGGGQPRGGEGRARGIPQFSPEQLKAAYEAQATHLSKANSLSADETTKVVEAYQAARDSQTKALAAMLAKLQEERRAAGGGGEGGGGGSGAGGGAGAGGGEAGGGAGGEGGGRRGGGAAMAEERTRAMTEVNKTEKEKLVAALNGFLKPEQTEKLAGPLGLFDRTWDQASVAVTDLKLDADKQDQAMGFTQGYSAAVLKARENPDREARQEATVEARRKMLDEMKTLLNDEEAYTKFQRAVGGGTGRGPGGGAEGAPGRRPPGGGTGGDGGGQGGAGGAGGG